MKKVLFNRKAAQEFPDATNYYNNESPGLGDELYEEIHQALSLIFRYPEIGLPLQHNLRRFVLVRSPYYIIYRALFNGSIRILAVAHQKRNPEYFQ